MCQVNEWENEWMNPGYLGLKIQSFLTLLSITPLIKMVTKSLGYFYNIPSLYPLYSDCNFFGGLTF